MDLFRVAVVQAGSVVKLAKDWGSSLKCTPHFLSPKEQTRRAKSPLDAITGRD
jgi:hypothetical protein